MGDFDFLYENDDDNVFHNQGRVMLFRRYIRDFANPIERYTADEFRKRYRFRKDTVRDVLPPIIFEDLIKLNNRELPIPPLLQLLMALRFYATNSFQAVHGDMREFHQYSVCRLVKKVSIAFARRLGQYVKFLTTNNGARDNIRRFYNKAHFPNVSGCIDGTHIPIVPPDANNAELYRNRHGRFSLNVQVVAGPRMEILDIVVRHPGSSHDAGFIIEVPFAQDSIKMKYQVYC
ncbi:hypothetical protein NQ315_007340 [Exocentrus adspersus]|uniref:DDE Tnp4 domain-containing protein n=1 Tax=Exocentrus adspersus TaxID=1586481 RepID=A0AAV8V651_9CUCU|nr:hypothetical protein NQ315_007340 [Exocentrus adspersus]